MNEKAIPFFNFLDLYEKDSNTTSQQDRNQRLLRCRVGKLRTTFPKQHPPKLWQFTGRTLIAVAGARVLLVWRFAVQRVCA